MEIIIDFVPSKSNISKDFKQDLLRLMTAMLAAQTVIPADPVKLKVSKSIQTEIFAFVGSPNKTRLHSRHNHQKRVRQPPVDELPSQG